MKHTLYINILGGPGVGKTTLLAEWLLTLKKSGASVEIVLEHAKELVWAKKFRELSDQYAVSREQYERLAVLNGKVDFVVTDGPLAHGFYYSKENESPEKARLTCASLGSWIDGFHNFNIFLSRHPDRPYDDRGRYQTDVEEAREVDKRIAESLERNDITIHFRDVYDDALVPALLAFPIFKDLPRGCSVATLESDEVFAPTEAKI